MPFGTGLQKLIPTFSYQPVQVAENLVKKFDGKLVVDLGAGGRRIEPWVKTVDFVHLPGTDYVCDFINKRTPFNSGSVDLVINTGVLEHVTDEKKLIIEINRILKIGGLLHIEVPFLQNYHEDPIDLRRLTLPGLTYFLENNGFEIVKSGVHIGPTVTILTSFAYYLNLIFGGNNIFGKIFSNLAFFSFSLIFWPLRYIDRWLIKKPDALRLAFGVYATARKIRDEPSG